MFQSIFKLGNITLLTTKLSSIIKDINIYIFSLQYLTWLDKGTTNSLQMLLPYIWGQNLKQQINTFIPSYNHRVSIYSELKVPDF